MKSSDVLRLERYLTFHLAEILEKLKSESEGDSNGDLTQGAKWASTPKTLRKYLVRSRVEITSALARIQEGTYGNCVVCGNEIDLRRLEAVPWSRLCIVCHEESERRQGSEGTQGTSHFETSSSS